MRLWTINFKYLDAKGLVALWREALLAKNVLEGLTKGYKNHPQLIRFYTHQNFTDAINAYLFEVYKDIDSYLNHRSAKYFKDYITQTKDMIAGKKRAELQVLKIENKGGLDYKKLY